MSQINPTTRFSDRVDNYVNYRPRYPRAVLDVLTAECGLTPSAIIADIGSGTGFLSELFVQNGNRVYGVEPNAEMRAAGEKLLAAYPTFTSVAATAEATTLPAASMDFVTAGQAFHWFDPAPTRTEFARILRPRGWVVLVWNERRSEATAFQRGYEALTQRYNRDYAAVNHRRIAPATIAAFYAPGLVQVRSFTNQQTFDFAGLQGRLLSSSYTLTPDHLEYVAMLADLRALFDAHQQQGVIVFEYDTQVYTGHLE